MCMHKSVWMYIYVCMYVCVSYHGKHAQVATWVSSKKWVLVCLILLHRFSHLLHTLLFLSWGCCCCRSHELFVSYDTGGRSNPNTANDHVFHCRSVEAPELTWTLRWLIMALIESICQALCVYVYSDVSWCLHVSLYNCVDSQSFCVSVRWMSV